MFSDSHAHIFMILQRKDNDFSFLKEMTDKKFHFLMDIGTKPGDLSARMKCIKEVFNGNIPDFISFSAGLWPDKQSILNPVSAIAALTKDIDFLLSSGARYCALGECGLDRHWNGEAAVMALETGLEAGTPDIGAEENLFKKQLELAKEKNLAVIIHSREAFKDTLKCIDAVGHHKGVIHCYSYGLDEARLFLERGWYISFPGNITYPKKAAEKEAIANLVKSIPHERLLLETDAPYLAPKPFRGTVNTPLLIEYTYAAVSEMLELSMGELSDLVYQNCCECFKISR